MSDTERELASVLRDWDCPSLIAAAIMRAIDTRIAQRLQLFGLNKPVGAANVAAVDPTPTPEPVTGKPGDAADRERFESWAHGKGFLAYDGVRLHFMWLAWVAAQEQLS